MKKKKHDAIVYEPKELLNPAPNVTNCCKSLWVKYSFQNAYMTRLVSSQPVSAMSSNPGKILFVLNLTYDYQVFLNGLKYL